MILSKKYFLLAVLNASVLLLSGCGYKIGIRGMSHPQIKSIAIAPVKNDTLEPLAAGIMRMVLAEYVQTDGAYVLKNMGEGDCVMYARITKVENITVRQGSSDDDLTYRPNEFRLKVTLEFEVLIPGRGEPFVKKRTVTGFSDYQVFADPAVNRATALKYACYHAAKQAIQYTSEAW